MSTDNFTALLSRGTEKKYGRNEEVFTLASSSQEIFYVRKGYLVLSRPQLRAKGNRMRGKEKNVLRTGIVRHPGEWIGLQEAFEEDEHYNYDARAVMSSSAVRLDRSIAMQDPDFFRDVYMHEKRTELDQYRRFAQFKDVCGRVAAFVQYELERKCLAPSRTRGEISLLLPSHGDIKDVLGTSRKDVWRSFQKMREEGVVVKSGRAHTGKPTETVINSGKLYEYMATFEP